MIGVKAVPPMPPRLEIVKDPPCMSAGLNRPARAFSEITGKLAQQISIQAFRNIPLTIIEE